ncbi:hypothetical protein BHQ15_00185 [Mycolicibacillus koreensis]|nr:hypothetical protein BHQ15_00185 [Mycolicibacillus koreensis]
MELVEWPFRADEALRAQRLTRRELRRFFTGVYPGVWIPRGVELTPRQRACAAWLWSRRCGVLAGLSAAAMLDTKWIDAGLPAELIHTNRRPPPLLTVHTDRLTPEETREVAGVPVTTPARTAFDLGRRLPLIDGVQRLDALINATDLKVPDVAALATVHPRVPGLRRLAATLALVDGGAESPYESMTRLMLVRAGFPRPQTQIKVCDAFGRVIARIDLGWREWQVGVDFDGRHHWTSARQRAWDAERYSLLGEFGWTDIRLTSWTLHRAPEVFLRRVGEALIARGCPKTW